MLNAAEKDRPGKPLLEIEDLKTYFYTEDGVARAVDGVHLSVTAGEMLGIVGESGCGKSMTALSILRLIPTPPGRIVGGRILFNGRDLLKLSETEMRQIRGNHISMIFQEPMTSLNPVFTVGDQIAETLRFHRGLSKRQSQAAAVELLKKVGIPSPETRVKEYPHQMSGGMRQRVMIAMAVSCNPNLIIADEPTTALDVTIQAQILELLAELKEEIKTAIILITHDLGVVAEYAQKMAVMYAGRIYEQTDVQGLFTRPLHPYTQGLIASIPKVEARQGKLNVIPGLVPNLLHLPPGCRFSDRCPEVRQICRDKEPDLLAYEPGHLVRCWLYASRSGSSDDDE